VVLKYYIYIYIADMSKKPSILSLLSRNNFRYSVLILQNTLITYFLLNNTLYVSNSLSKVATYLTMPVDLTLVILSIYGNVKTTLYILKNFSFLAYSICFFTALYLGDQILRLNKHINSMEDDDALARMPPMGSSKKVEDLAYEDAKRERAINGVLFVCTITKAVLFYFYKKNSKQLGVRHDELKKLAE
jgi:hypothetical protein